MTAFFKWDGTTRPPAATRAVALGVFDGLHIGHRAVIHAAVGVRSATDASLLPACVLSLQGVPKTGDRITHPTEQAQLCTSMGVDEWWEIPFSLVQELSPAQFVTRILKDTFGVAQVCCGENFRFGKNAAGDAQTLRRLCEPLGITVTVVPAVTRDGEPVSATAVREALAAGELPRVSGLLGRSYGVCLPVSHGNRLGRRLGFPTVNQVFPIGTALPRFGVYASLVVIDDTQYHAVTNVGVHPTVGGCSSPQAETWIADYEGDLYGRQLTVELIAFLREEQRFETVEALKARIEQDKAAALSLLRGEDGIKAVLFDFDDTLANRPRAFVSCMTEMIAAHCPSLPAEEVARRARQMLRENRGGYVQYASYFDRFFTLWDWEGVADSQQLFDEFLRRFGDHTCLLPEVPLVLRELRRRGYRLGLVTNGSGLLQNRKLDTAGIRPLLDAVTVCGDEGVQKPHPEPFLRTAARLGVAPQHCVFVGDYEPTDLRGATAAGMRPLRIDLYHPESDAPVHSPTDLLNML